MTADSLDSFRRNVRSRLLDARTTEGHWEGSLSSSALSTATAVCVMRVAEAAPSHAELARAGMAWLGANQNDDGGWGDTVDSPSNLSTTVLCWSQWLTYDSDSQTTRSATQWIEKRVGSADPAAIAFAIEDGYGKDRTFAVPILAMCAVSGAFGEPNDAWRHVRPFPFELALVPRTLFRHLRLAVVSYALPALIAIGYARFYHRPPRNPVSRVLRCASAGRALRLLREIQPASGGFLEAIPLTSLVVMNLAACRDSGTVRPVIERGLEFLCRTARKDGSWPIDSNLATWLTTLSVNALGGGDQSPEQDQPNADVIRTWILDQQITERNRYTDAAPGGWAWTDLSGGVPDADDTSGCLLALHALGPDRPESVRAAHDGIQWLLSLRNRDGGVPTFCRGWGHLPFDRSCPDITIHACQALDAWRSRVEPRMQSRIDAFQRSALNYLERSQTCDNSWLPLWFGAQGAPGMLNPLYGTTRVVRGLAQVGSESSPMLLRGVEWLLDAQDAGGGWGALSGATPTIEETALALEALAAVFDERSVDELRHRIQGAAKTGLQALQAMTTNGTRFPPSPIGLYFSKLWYSEALYPVIFALAALEQCVPLFRERGN